MTEKYVTAHAISHTDCTIWGGDAAGRVQQTKIINNIAGSALRVRVSNAYGKTPLIINGIAVSCGDMRVAVSFAGKAGITLAVGESAISDGAQMRVAAGEVITVETELAKQPAPVSGNSTCDTLLSRANGAPGWRRAVATIGFLGVDVLTAESPRVVACFGDSITQMRLWTRPLAAKLYAAYPGEAALLNCGICGNRLLFRSNMPDVGNFFGESGLSRFHGDVLALCGVTDVILALGVNDIGHPGPGKGDAPLCETVTAQMLDDGYNELIDAANARGIRVFGATITPFGKSEGFTWEKEAVRVETNALIRKNGRFAGVIDFDAAVHDENEPSVMAARCESDDGLHPGASGGIAMANAVDIKRLMEL